MVCTIRIVAMFAGLILVGCGGGSPAAPAAQPYAVAVMANLQPVTGSPVVLFGSQFIDPFPNFSTLTVSITPTPSTTPTVVWSGGTTAIALSTAQPYCQGCPSPPPGGIYAVMQQAGTATVTASIGPPVNSTVSVQVFAYPSLVVGCSFRYRPSYDFDSANTVSDLTSDLYATESQSNGGALDPCSGTVFATGTAALHYPYGGIVVPGNFATFPTIGASQWQNAGTSVSGSNSVLLFKTRGGAIVKTIVPLGPYEVTDASGKFPY